DRTRKARIRSYVQFRPPARAYGLPERRELFSAGREGARQGRSPMGSLASLQYRAPWTAGRRDGGGLFRDEVIAQLVTGYLIRPVEARDEQAVLALVNADRVPGQPLATSAMLAEALAGRSSVDSGWWAELADLTTEVATTRDGEIVGVVSYATRPRDGVGIVLWLH